jgi:alpha-L-rhamnosidase
VNTTAKVYLPALKKEDITEGGVIAENAKEVSYVGSEKNDAVGNYVIYNIASGVYDFNVEILPEVSFPDPIEISKNLATLGRMNASSMFIETEKLPGFEAFKSNDENPETRWLADDSNNQYLEVEWVKPQTFNTVVIDEHGDHISKYSIEYFNDDKWVILANGSKCGVNKEHVFEMVTSNKCRIYIDYSNNSPSISEIEIYKDK